MPPELIEKMLAGSEFLSKNCLHSQIIITVEGVTLAETKEFHPSSETQPEKLHYGFPTKHINELALIIQKLQEVENLEQNKDILLECSAELISLFNRLPHQ